MDGVNWARKFESAVELQQLLLRLPSSHINRSLRGTQAETRANCNRRNYQKKMLFDFE